MQQAMNNTTILYAMIIIVLIQVLNTTGDDLKLLGTGGHSNSFLLLLRDLVYVGRNTAQTCDLGSVCNS